MKSLLSPRNVPVILGSLLGLVAILSWVLISGPLILPDESSFLLGAYELVGRTGATGYGYHPGYSLLLAPFAAATDDLLVIFRIAQVINVGLTVCSVFLARALVKELDPELSGRDTLTLSLLTMLYPAYRVFAALSLSENLLIPMSLLVALLVVKGRRGVTWQLGALGLVAGLTFAVHARALVVPLAALCAGLYMTRRQPKKLGWLVGGVVLGTAVSFGFVDAVLAVNGAVETSSDSRLTLGGLLRENTSVSAIYTLPFTALGQFFYVSVATLGLLPAGILHLVSRFRRKSSDDPTACLAAFALPLFAGSLGLSSMFLNEQTGDQAIYGRYLEGVSAPLLLAGLLWLRSANPVLVRRYSRMLASSFPIVALLLVIGRGAATFMGRTQLVNITGIYPVVIADGVIRLSTIALVGLVVVLGLEVLHRRDSALAVVAIGLVFAGVSAFDIQQAGQARSDLASAVVVGDRAAELAASFDLSCVGIDQTDLEEVWHTEFYRIDHLDLRFEHWSGDEDSTPCSDLVVSRRTDLALRFPGASLVALEPGWAPLLWVLPGETQDEMRASGVALSDQPFTRLGSEASLSIAITLVDDDGNRIERLEVEQDEILSGRVTITNIGSQEVTPSAGFERRGGANLGFEWRSSDDPTERTMEPFRAQGFDTILYPGESIDIEFEVPVNAQGLRLLPGRYFLRTELVSEDIEWTNFSASLEMVVFDETE